MQHILLVSSSNLYHHTLFLWSIVPCTSPCYAVEVFVKVGNTHYVAQAALKSCTMSVNILISLPCRIVQAPLSDLCSLQNCGNASFVLNDSIQGVAPEPNAVPVEHTQPSVPQLVDPTVSDEKTQSSKVQPTEIDITEPLMDEDINQDGSSSLG